MILDSTRPVDLSEFLHVQSLAVELMYIDLPAGRSAFEHPKALRAFDDAAADFPVNVDDRVEHEDEIRRGLGWILNLDEHQFDRLLRRRLDLVLASRLVSDHRRHFELLWESAFNDWRSKPHDPRFYEVLDLPDGADPPIAVDSVQSIDFSVILGVLRPPLAADPEETFRALTGDPASENDARLGLWWLLHQDDETLGDSLVAGDVVLASIDISRWRDRLQRLWDRLFADWLVEGFTMTDYDVRGLRR